MLKSPGRPRVKSRSTPRQACSDAGSTVGDRLVRDGPAVCCPAQADGGQLDLPLEPDPVRELAAAGVVDVDHGVATAGRGEQRGLGLEVGLLVGVEVEVIATEVGEGGDVEGDGVGPAEHQRVRGHLQESRVRPLFEQVTQQALQLGRLRSGHRGAGPGQRLAVEAVAHRADHPGVPAGRPERRLQQESGGGLPVGPGDRERAQPVGRSPVERGRQGRHQLPRIGDHHDRQPGPETPGTCRIGQPGTRPHRSTRLPLRPYGPRPRTRLRAGSGRAGRRTGRRAAPAGNRA